ncbi:MAG: hypothetical protein Q8P18_03975 [Pseudomonadota bacterium]|nr:hypothetical protein [Pseudomonadota bacterium]
MHSADTVISRRTSALAAWEVPLLAALLAADAASPTGFRPQDVRFFFLLFTNWMGDDHLRPGADLDATQVRRTLQRLAGDGLAHGVGAGRAPRWSLVATGVVRLVEALTDPRAPRRFEEVVLIATVAVSYVDTIAARARGGAGASGAPGGASGVGRTAERRVRARLDPRAILRAERRRLGDALADLEARRDAGLVLGAAAREALAAGADPLGAAARLEAEGRPYQLHAMRPLHELIEALPEPLRRFEMEQGMELRARWMFAPLCEELRGRIAVLARLEG